MPELSDQSALFAAPNQTDPQTGPLLSDQEQEASVSPQVQEADAALQPLADEKEEVTFKPAPEPSTARSFWQPPFRYVPVLWSLLLSVVLALILTTSALSWLNGIPSAKSRESAPHTIGAKVSMRSSFPIDDAVPAAYGVRGQLVLDDPLTSAHTQGAWHITDPHKPLGCSFIPGGYDMKNDASNYCLADETDFTNFVYQIDMTTIQGGTGGIVFRVNDEQDSYYNFQVSIDGHYKFYRSGPVSDTPDSVIGTGWSSAIVQGYHCHNLLAVKAIGDNLFLYINFRLMEHIQDRSYTHGNVGVDAMVAKGQRETEVTFSNARVWAV